MADPIPDDQRQRPPRHRRLIGKAITRTVARFPALWPVLRGPTRRFFDERATDWDRRTGARSAEYLASLGAALLHVSPEPERALELGTGTGVGALLMAREFPHARVRGVDISEEMVRRAKERVGLDPEGRVAFRVADAADLPFEDDSFDLVAQINVPAFFRETNRVLRPGGFVIVADSWGEATPFHTPHSALQRGFEREGLEVVATDRAANGTYFVARAPGT